MHSSLAKAKTVEAAEATAETVARLEDKVDQLLEIVRGHFGIADPDAPAEPKAAHKKEK